MPHYHEYQQRVIDERDELLDKTNKLRVFISSNPTFKKLDPYEQTMLEQQLVHMLNYYNILVGRVKWFESNK